MREPARGVRAATAATVIALLATAQISAQERGTIIGGVAGYSATSLQWRPAVEGAAVGGIMVGAFAEASTPVGWLSVLAEGAYTRRGGDIERDLEGRDVNGRVRADYLSIAVHARAAVSIGRARLHMSAGPTVDQLLRRRMDAATAAILPRETPSVFGVSVGLGAGARVTTRVFAEVEARLFEGLSRAHAGDFLTVRNRSFEVVTRIGVPLRR
ncbi:MAG: outer membrane beta-barrel protein [Gemmatimonadetes bacterium]|nr:outer membrane beta-barrel protein [Gemmatimonadota bacterium]MDA1103462.1 outer membrane beta-barrel protein [Gemmatimonadota bacterium]